MSSANRFFTFLNTLRLIPNTVAKSDAVNGIFDSVEAGDLAIQKELNRALKLPSADDGAEHNFAADAATRASKIMQFDATGNPIASNQLATDLDANSKKITNLPSPLSLGEAVTLGYLNAFSASLAGLPSIGGQSGKYLNTDGTTVFWATIPAIPTQSGATANKFLMSDGASAAWQTVPNTVPSTTDFGVPLSHDGASFAFRRELANLIFNPSGAVNYAGTSMSWTSTTVTMTPTFGVRGWRFESGTLGSASSGNHECASFAFPGSTDIAVSAEVDSTAQTAGTLTLVVDFRDSGDASISTSSLAIASGVNKRYAFTATSPSNCAKVRVRLVYVNVTSSGAIALARVKAERGTSATPFNDAATLDWAAGFKVLTELGRGYASPIVRIGDASSTGSKLQMRSTSGAQAHDAEWSVTGGTSGTAGKGDVTLTSRSFKHSTAIGYTSEFDNGNSGASKTIDWANGAYQRITLNNAAPALTLGVPLAVGRMRLKFIQDGTGNRVPTYAGQAVTWAGTETPFTGTTPGANAICFVDFYYDGSTLWGSWTPW